MGECRTCQHWTVGQINNYIGTCARLGAFQYGQRITLTYGGCYRIEDSPGSDFEEVRTKFNFGCIGYSEIPKPQTIEDIMASDYFKSEIESATRDLQAILPDIDISATQWALGGEKEKVVRVDIFIAGRTLKVIFTLNNLLSHEITISKRIKSEVNNAVTKWFSDDE